MDNICCSKQEPFEYALSIVSGKWKLKILFQLACNSMLRYGEMKRNISCITHKMLSTQLKELENDGMIIRKEYPQIPPKVEYSLSSKGLAFLPILDGMCNWGNKFNA
jgi:DNA-binding HxlR family transcriptional regulator